MGAGLLLGACANPATLETNRPSEDSGHDGGLAHEVSAGQESGVAGPTSRPTPSAAPLREGERFIDLRLPVSYTPQTQTSGTDDYRCFVLDPGLTTDALVAGIDITPDNVAMVHHVIVYKVLPDQVEVAQALQAAQPDPGYSCFGGSGLEVAAGTNLDQASWIGAWAPGGGERVLPEDVGIPLPAGSRLIVQMHYSTLVASGADQSDIRLRVADDDGRKASLDTMLLPAPVELPCRTRNQGGLCVREAAKKDVVERFGQAGRIGDMLHVLCGGTPPGRTTSCTRQVREPGTIRAVGGHMHLLGKSITIDINKGTPQARRILDVPVWNFDEQGAVSLQEPAQIAPGDTLTVTCTHDQTMRDLLPALADIPERYVIWGEGTADEMCLGTVLLTRP